jgi:DNA polymerase
VELWHPAFPKLGMPEAGERELIDLLEWVDSGQLVEAHNAAFERAIWTNIGVPRHGWSRVEPHQWRCSAAKAAAHALPRSLDDAIEALFLDVKKDMEGSALMKKLVKPRNPKLSDWQAWGRQNAPCKECSGTGRVVSVKKDGTPTKRGATCGTCDGAGYNPNAVLPPMPTLYHESVEQFERLFAYCRQDVLAEESLSERIPDLSDEENELYVLDQTINERGFRLDREAIDAALALIDGEFAGLNAELQTLTGGQVEKATQRKKMLAWLETEGVFLDDTTADTVDRVLEKPTGLPDKARRGLEILRLLGRSSTAKYERMADVICPDDRARGSLLFHGASTGRWTGAGIQPHNFPRGEIKDPVTHEAPDPELLWAFLKTRDRELITAEYGGVMPALSSALRGVIVPTPGKDLFVSDFSGIEACVLFWVAGDEVGLQILREGGDLYNEMATTIFGHPVFRKKDEHKEKGQVGKVAILGLGYQMGAAKFVETAWDLGGVKIVEDLYCQHKEPRTSTMVRREFGQPETATWTAVCGLSTKQHGDVNHPFTHDKPDTMTAVKVVDAYRTKFHRVKAFWRDIERAAIAAVRNKGSVETCGPTHWFCHGDFLYCELPSGRMLAYPYPTLQKTITSWGEERAQLTYMGMSQFSHRWDRQHSYGGMLTENVVQAIARDLIAAAMLRCERAGYEVVLSVHDELLAEREIGKGDAHEFNRLMAVLPTWAAGCPVKAEGWSGPRYKK